MKDKSTQQKRGQNRPAPEGFERHISERPGHQCDGKRGSNPEAQGDKENWRNLRQGFLDNREGAAPNYGYENERQIGLGSLGDFHGGMEILAQRSRAARRPHR